jgi:hypothetical protein
MADSSIFGIFDPLFDGPEEIQWDGRDGQLAANKNGTAHFEHALEERGYLEFNFPASTKPMATTTNTHSGADAQATNTKVTRTEDARARLKTEGPVKKYLPFFENPKIVESRSALYVDTPIFMRNEPVRLWTGASPRRFALELHYTIPHIAAYLNNYLENPKFFPKEAKEEVLKVQDVMQTILQKDQGEFGPLEAATSGQPPIKVAGGKNSVATIGVDGMLVDPHRGVGDGPRMPVNQGVVIDSGNNYRNNVAYYNARMLNAPRHTLVATAVQMLLNIIRSAVTASVNFDKKYGPPLCKMKFGSVYLDTPCIVKSYKITLDPFRAQGMDHATLLSRMVLVNLELEEFNQSAGVLATPEWGGVTGWDTIMRRGHSDVVPPPPSQTPPDNPT